MGRWPSRWRIVRRIHRERSPRALARGNLVIEMSSTADPQPEANADEIVAYLDGELPPDDCRRVESRLATDDDFRQQLHDLDRTWEVLDVLPTPTVEDGFARTTIELACVAAEADLDERKTVDKTATRNRRWRWLAGGVAAAVFGYLVGRAVVGDHDERLLADLPAIQQLSALEDVESVEFLRKLGTMVPPEQLIKDMPTYTHSIEELERASDDSLNTRREWVRSLSPEQKAELADRERAFADLEPASGERVRVRNLSNEIRNAADSAQLQKTLIAFGQWMARHSAGQQQQLRDELEKSSSPERQAAIVKNALERENEFAMRHLSDQDAKAFLDELELMISARKAEVADHQRQRRKQERGQNLDDQPRQRASITAELFRPAERDKTEARLISKLSPEAQAYWQKLDREHREVAKLSQMMVWVRDVMNPTVNQQKLEEYFAGDKLTDDQKQLLLEMPNSKMKTALERMYFQSELGIENPGQFLSEFGELNRMQWMGPGFGRPREGEGRPRFGRDQRPDRGPEDRHALNRPPRGPGNPPGSPGDKPGPM
jgi:hypothetical protein